MNLNLTNQQNKVDVFLPYLQQFKDELEKRKVLLNKLSPEQAKQLYQIDPVLQLAKSIKDYLDDYETVWRGIVNG